MTTQPSRRACRGGRASGGRRTISDPAAYPLLMALHIGAHVDQEDPIAEARARGATLSQFFLGDPQSWKGPVIRVCRRRRCAAADAEAAGIDLYVHAPYPINVASPTTASASRAASCCSSTCTAAAEIGAKGVIVHGGHVLRRGPRRGLRQLAQVHRRPRPAGARCSSRTPPAATTRWPAGSRRSAGCGTPSARPRAATTSASASTPATHTPAGSTSPASSTRSGRSPGASTSSTPTTRATTFDSGADRHTNFGSGTLDGAAVAALVRAAGAPVVCETPGGLEGQAADISWLRSQLD